MAIVKHPKNRHVMAVSKKSEPYVNRPVKPHRKAARAAKALVSDSHVPESPGSGPIPKDADVEK